VIRSFTSRAGSVPVTAGPVCVIYNLPGLSAPLRFSGKSLLTSILGPSLVDSSLPSPGKTPASNLPHTGITVMHRVDGSGTTSIFTSYLSSVSAI
jgi:phosphate transport system substrate-binding protein